MLTKKIEDAINFQINAEFWSGYLYLAMACDLDDKGFKGIANWYKVQFEEEFAHARIFINHVLARGGRVTLAPIKEVPTTFDSPLDCFNKTLLHERKVSGLVNNLYALAEEEHDYATRQMLNWFVAEQVEEEDMAQELIDDLKLIGNDGTGLYQFDRELAKRVYKAPALLTGESAE